MTLVAPSILSADFGHLSRDIEMLNESEADWIHCDVMDGVYVPNISFGLPVIKAVNKVATKPMDVHLMIANADPFIRPFADAGADLLTVHYEACTHIHRTLQAIRAAGVKTGVALNPGTPVSVLSEIIADLDLVLIMSVNPGFGGQKFIEGAYSKIRETVSLRAAKGSTAMIQVDGGVTDANAGALARAGADLLVAGSYVFGADDPKEAIHKLKMADKSPTV